MIRPSIVLAALCLLPCAFADSMQGMTSPNRLGNGRFEETSEVAYPWTGVDQWGNLRKSVAMRGVNLHVDRSNQFDYAFMGNSASFVDLNGDRLPDIISPDGAGFFWFWKNVGTPGNPRFGFGEVMPLLVDNERSTFRKLPHLAKNKVELTSSQLKKKERVDEKREKELKRMQKRNERNPPEARWAEEDLLDMIAAKFPYPWETKPREVGSTYNITNGYRQLRAVAAPCFWDRNDTVDFLVGDAQGNLYQARNSGTRQMPNFRTYRKKTDSLILKLALDYNPVLRKNEFRPVQFLNYAVPYVVDWNRNGVPDLLLGEGTYSTNAVRLYLDPANANPSTGSFPEERVLYVGEERTFLAPSAWDWDGDGFHDLIVADADGKITIHPNPDGRFGNGTREMEDFVTVEMDGNDPELLHYCTPQPCDWNADGVMDLIWSGPFGRILVSLGKEKGGTAFTAPNPVKSIQANSVRKLSIPHQVASAAVPAYGKRGRGGTADSRRLFSSVFGSKVNQGGWPNWKSRGVWYGLMPNWDPEVQLPRYQEMMNNGFFHPEKFYRNGMVASYGIAPVPYEVIGLVPEAPSPGKGQGTHTLLQTWHNPASNQVFRQPRDEITAFGQGVSFHFGRPRSPKIRRKGVSSKEVDAWMKDNLHPGNIRVSFYMRLDGDFSRMTVHYSCRHWNRDSLTLATGGEVNFRTMDPPPTGRWFHYESIVNPSEFPRTFGSLSINLYGRGEVRIRDVAVGDTNRPKK